MPLFCFIYKDGQKKGWYFFAISQMMITELMTEGNKIFDSHYIINYYLKQIFL